MEKSIKRICIREAIKRNTSHKGVKVQKRGGGSAAKEKSTIQNIDYFDMRGGSGSSGFSQIQMTEIQP